MDTKDLAVLSFTAVKSRTNLPKPLTYTGLGPIQVQTQLHICSCPSLKAGRSKSSGLIPGILTGDMNPLLQFPIIIAAISHSIHIGYSFNNLVPYLLAYALRDCQSKRYQQYLPPPTYRNVQMSQYFEQTVKTPWVHSIVKIMVLHLTTSGLTTYMCEINNS